MKCPLHLTIKVYPDDTTMERLGDCLKEKCALWGKYRSSQEEESGCCSIPAIALSLTDIMNKMPYEGQLRR
ncbi:hypothetical protein LCGC14_2650860 [marine sediment metagenome]|uniref:Uncharacterized protein n=1 Tax=marine sediment metagenome TaxID=412755 RepID=A0A0F9C573_9ZZZZ